MWNSSLKHFVNISMVIENAVAQALIASGHELFFHKFDRHEIDFLITSGEKLLPIEVKSSSYHSHKSLDKRVLRHLWQRCKTRREYNLYSVLYDDVLRKEQCKKGYLTKWLEHPCYKNS